MRATKNSWSVTGTSPFNTLSIPIVINLNSFSSPFNASPPLYKAPFQHTGGHVETSFKVPPGTLKPKEDQFQVVVSDYPLGVHEK